jgi:hypothetical protein
MFYWERAVKEKREYKNLHSRIILMYLSGLCPASFFGD